MKITYIENGVSKEREATSEEVAYIESAQAEAQAAKAIEEAEAAAREALRQSRREKLIALGLTEEELDA